MGAVKGRIVNGKTDLRFPLADSISELTFDSPPLTTSGIGAKGGPAVASVTEYGDGIIHKTVLTLTAMGVTLGDTAGTGQYGGVKVYDMPAGNNIFLGAVLDANITLVGAEWTDTAEGDIGVGTVVVNDGAAMTGTEVNIIPSTAIPAMTAQTGTCNAGNAAAAVIAAAGTTDTSVYVNVRIDDAAAHIAATGTITGTLTLTWINAGDF